MEKRNSTCPAFRDRGWLGCGVASISSFPVAKRALQALSTISVNEDIPRRCLHKLQVVYGHRATLPSSYIISGEIVRVDDGPIALGGITDVWEGTYDDKKAAVKHWRIPLNDNQTLEKSFILRRHHYVEMIRRPRIVPFIGVITDALQIVSEWTPDRTLVEFKKNSGAKRISLPLDIAEGLDYHHANHTTHGNSKGPNVLVGHDSHALLTNFESTSIVCRELRNTPGVLGGRIQSHGKRTCLLLEQL